MGLEKQRKIINVERGLFLVRYASAADENDPPKIVLAAERDSRRALELILPPGEAACILWRPGACAVLRAAAPGKLIIEVEPAAQSASAASSVRLEPLSLGQSAQTEGPVDPNAPLNMTGFALVGHVAGRGDVRVRADEWLAGPSAPSRIEGVSIEWEGRPVGINIQYSVTTAKPQMASERPVKIGGFAGTRGKALPVVALDFELMGEGAVNAQLVAHGIFLGSPSTHSVGRRISLAGPTGREPLVGLRLTVERIARAPTARPAEKRDGANRVRVFRGRTKSASPPDAISAEEAKAG